MSRSKAAKLLIDMGAPAGVYDIKGEVALSLLILKMPDVALVALDQFHSEDMINRKEYYFLNYLEGPRLLEDKVSFNGVARQRTGGLVDNEFFLNLKG